MYQHQSYCRLPSHSDEAKRLCDTYNLHRIAGGNASIGKWFAASLAEGKSDNQLYDNKLDCVTHQRHNEKYYAFIKIVPASMSQCDAEIMLQVQRRLYESGLRVADPDDKHGGKDLIKRASIEDQLALSQGFSRNITF